MTPTAQILVQGKKKRTQHRPFNQHLTLFQVSLFVLSADCIRMNILSMIFVWRKECLQQHFGVTEYIRSDISSLCDVAKQLIQHTGVVYWRSTALNASLASALPPAPYLLTDFCRHRKKKQSCTLSPSSLWSVWHMMLIFSSSDSQFFLQHWLLFCCWNLITFNSRVEKWHVAWGAL